jgi:hypothetical protein
MLQFAISVQSLSGFQILAWKFESELTELRLRLKFPLNRLPDTKTTIYVHGVSANLVRALCPQAAVAQAQRPAG